MIKSKDFTMALKKTGSGRTCSRALMTGRLCLGSPYFANGRMGPTVLGKLIWIFQKWGTKPYEYFVSQFNKEEKARIPRAPPRPHAHIVLYFAHKKALQMWNSFFAWNNSKDALKNWDKHQNNEKFNFHCATKQNHYFYKYYFKYILESVTILWTEIWNSCRCQDCKQKGAQLAPLFSLGLPMNICGMIPFWSFASRCGQRVEQVRYRL